MGIEVTIRLVPIPGIGRLSPSSPLGLLAPLVGTWKGSGFNQIFRPQQPATGSDNFLELNLTNESIEFTEIPGEIPNRGFAQGDLSLFGLTYLQQVTDANVKDTQGNPAGIHIEPGIWLNIMPTQDPQEPATVARLANIPHGTSLVSQGTATIVSGPPDFTAIDDDITPFVIGEPGNKIHAFTSETTLADPSPFRSPPADIVGITQSMIDSPKSVLSAALGGKTINSTTRIQISTLTSATTAPDSGGGISDIAFLEGQAGNPNAQVAQMDATFWISEFTDDQGSGTILQYFQKVLLNFSTLSWPHISVATLTKQVTKPDKESKEKIEIKEKIEVKEHKAEFKENNKRELKEHKLELKEIEVLNPFPTGPGRAGPAAAAPAEGRHFILPDERPAVADPAAPDPPEPS